jgi:hypothetical protein
MMNIYQHLSQFPSSELSCYPGNKALRFKAFAPIFENLFEKKIVYHERFTRLVVLENMKITPESFFAKAIPLALIKAGTRLESFYSEKPWVFGAVWSHICYLDNQLMTPYANWSIWFEPILVERVEGLVLQEKFQEAHSLLH